MRIDNQAPVYNLASSYTNRNVIPNALPPGNSMNDHLAAIQKTHEQEQIFQVKQDAQYEAVKNQIYDASGQANRLPGTVSLFDATV